MCKAPEPKPRYRWHHLLLPQMVLVPIVLLGFLLLSCGRSPAIMQVQTPEPVVVLQPTNTEAVSLNTVTPTLNVTESAPVATVTPSHTPRLVAPIPTSTVAPSEFQRYLRTRYVLSASLDYETHHVTASEVVTYVNQSSESLFELLFVVEPNRYPGIFRLTDLRWADGSVVEANALDGAQLTIPLRDPLPPGASIGLSLAFELNLPAQSGPLGYTARQMNLGDWYPFLPPYRASQGWLVHEPSAVGEHLVYDVADYEVDIVLTEGATDLIVAASALADFEKNRYRYQSEAARGFVWSVSPEYQVLSRSVGDVLLLSYVFPEHVAAGEAGLHAAAEALALYSELLGPYPHDSLSMVEANFSDGMEYDGLYFLGEEYYTGYNGTPQGYLITLSAHETAHQWWYGLVGNDQAIEPWLDESLATYSELLFYEHVYPELVDWWWKFRVTRFRPAGFVDSTIYDHTGFRPYVNAVYLRGALFLHQLRNLMGDEAFFAFLRDYVSYGAHQQVAAEDFFAMLTEYTLQIFDSFGSTYFKANLSLNIEDPMLGYDHLLT